VTLIDTSTWIDHLRGNMNPSVQKLRDPTIAYRLLIGDIVLTEVLQGAKDEKDAGRLEAELRKLPIVAIVSELLAVKAARHYRIMRSFGFTMNKIADLVIGTYCIEHSHDLLHNDADFDPMEKFCGLRVLR
jgi:predicted nucleic acid-binding protein